MFVPGPGSIQEGPGHIWSATVGTRQGTRRGAPAIQWTWTSSRRCGCPHAACICSGTGLTPPKYAGTARQDLHRDWAHPAAVCSRLQLIADCGLLGADPAHSKLPREELNYVFWLVNSTTSLKADMTKHGRLVRADSKKENAQAEALLPDEHATHNDATELTSTEFVLALLHVAARVYSRQGVDLTLADKMQKLIGTIDAKAGQSTAQEFRALCKRPNVREVLAHYSEVLKKLFKYYACIENSVNDKRAEKSIKITMKTFLLLFKDAQLFDNVLTHKNVLVIFASCQVCITRALAWSPAHISTGSELTRDHCELPCTGSALATSARGSGLGSPLAAQPLLRRD